MKKLYTVCLLISLAFLCACHKKDVVTPTPVKPVIKPIDTEPVIDTTSSPDYHKDGDVAPLYPVVQNAVNIVILGDGFIHEDLKKGGSYDVKVKETIDYLFTVPPFNQYKQDFNTYIVYAESQTRGAAHSYSAANVNTKFNAYFDTNITRLLITGNTQACYNYVRRAMPIEQTSLIILLVNDDTYGGSGGQIAVVSTHPLSKYVMVHEIGHTFAGLGDEYVDIQAAPSYPISMVKNLPNVDDTNDSTQIKWGHYYSRPLYKNIVGAFEGAFYRQKGFYRPEQSSLMLDLNHTNYNAPSREAIARMIYSIKGKPFDLEAFLKSDSASLHSVISPRINTTLTLPKNDFLNMQKRILELNKIRKQ